MKARITGGASVPAVTTRAHRAPPAPDATRTKATMSPRHGRPGRAWLGRGGDGRQLSRRMRPALGDYLPRWHAVGGGAAGRPNQKREGLERNVRTRRVRFSRIKTANRATPIG